MLNRGATKTGRRNRPPYLCCGRLVSSGHHVDRLLLLGLALVTTETASNAALDAAACDVRRRCAAISGSTIAPQLMQRHPAYSWSPDPSSRRSSSLSRTINPLQRAHLISLPPSLMGPCVCYFSPFRQGLRLEVASTKRQAHNSHGAKNDENNVLHGVIVVLYSCSGHWNFPFLGVGQFGLPALHRLILSCLFHGSSTPVCMASY